MKKSIILAVVLLISLSVSFAQPYFGFRGGLNVTNVKITDDESDDVVMDDRYGYHGGLFMQYPLGAHFIIEPALLYSQRGYERTIDVPLLEDIKENINMDYIELPLALKFDINISDVHIQPAVAPRVGYAIVTQYLLNEEELDFPEDPILLDYGVDFGLDITFLNQFLIGARYSLGLADIYDDDNEDITTSNNGLMISLGVMF
ncbi:MAG TPA: porin family protein [Candidatus Syntrophosphaera sp.]|nr:PorT family protein [Candidatus Syntrophosphaera sp.]HOD59478.1 porin family protein [Candidatus Syntrophosphaera sp.]HQM79886.1 porin family protein [Candidatus Syntrophosphaera sp.]